MIAEDRLGRLADPGAFRCWAEDRLRFGDMDSQGHVNNAVYATFCESGRIALRNAPGHPPLPPGSGMVVVRFLINYIAELRWPGIVRTGTSLLAIGRSSLTMVHGVFRDDSVIATAESVTVLFDQATRRPRPLPDPVRDFLLRHHGLVGAPASSDG